MSLRRLFRDGALDVAARAFVQHFVNRMSCSARMTYAPTHVEEGLISCERQNWVVFADSSQICRRFWPTKKTWHLVAFLRILLLLLMSCQLVKLPKKIRLVEFDVWTRSRLWLICASLEGRRHFGWLVVRRTRPALRAATLI